MRVPQKAESRWLNSTGAVVLHRLSFELLIENEALRDGKPLALYEAGGLKMKKLTLMLAGALVAMAPLGASAAVRVFVGGPAFGYGFYGPYAGPGYYGYYAPYSNTGTVKIDSKAKEAQVFVNGSYAGLVKDNHTMHLRQGNYTIEVREGGATTFSENVYVTNGKTLHIAPAV